MPGDADGGGLGRSIVYTIVQTYQTNSYTLNNITTPKNLYGYNVGIIRNIRNTVRAPGALAEAGLHATVSCIHCSFVGLGIPTRYRMYFLRECMYGIAIIIHRIPIFIN